MSNPELQPFLHPTPHPCSHQLLYVFNPALLFLTVYASVRDYHFFVNELSGKLESYVKGFYPNCKFKVFADHSPIDEVHAACISGLGFIGDNGLLINEKYSSFVFLGECITDLSPSELGLEYAPNYQVRGCLHCGRCEKSCPSHCIGQAKDKKLECLSAITQKKGVLTEEEQDLIIENGSIWGCDICQNVCPFTKNGEFSKLDYFNQGVITCLNSDKSLPFLSSNNVNFTRKEL